MPSKKKPTSNQPAPKKYSYSIETGIIISGVRGTRADDKFPFPNMKVGDSFLIPKDDPLCKNPNTLHYAAKMFARMNPGFTITTRTQLDKSRRVWRLK